jgi:hypothetical protein
LIDYAKEGIGEPISREQCGYRDFSASCFFDYFCLLIVYFRAMRNNSQEPFPASKYHKNEVIEIICLFQSGWWLFFSENIENIMVGQDKDNTYYCCIGYPLQR